MPETTSVEPPPAEPWRPWRVTQRRRRAARWVLYLAVWAAVALLAATYFFLTSARATTLAGHDAVVRPRLDGYVVVQTGPVLPDVRVPSGTKVGVSVSLGKTEARSTDELLQRYAAIAAQPEGQVAQVGRVVRGMVVASALRGAVVGVVPVLVLVLLGSRRRRELATAVVSWRGAAAVGVLGVLAVGLWQPWGPAGNRIVEGRTWVPLQTFVGPDVPLPASVMPVEVRGDVTTAGTRRLVASAVDTYERGKRFYADALAGVDDLALRTPEPGETVVAMVSDRHDNVGMDEVARAIADRAGATGVFDGGDDTSSGRGWEAFSLDSVTAAFDGYDGRWAVTGNHDNGSFVGGYLAERGWTVLAGEEVPGPDGTRLLGVPDPRSSGLGTWRDEVGLSFDEVASRLADTACEADADGRRIQTLLVHDVALGQEALDRGCTDLVLGGHLHVQVGPTRVDGPDGRTGWSYTTGTTGGAAYALAIGSKLRRTAEVSLVTYADGAPAGIQGVQLDSSGRYTVGDYVPLTP